MGDFDGTSDGGVVGMDISQEPEAPVFSFSRSRILSRGRVS